MSALENAVSVIRLPGFRRLLVSQAASEIGDWMTNVALILLVFRLLDHPAAASLVLLAKLLPRALLYPIGGLLADAFDRRALMIGADVLRAGLALSLLLVQSPDGLWWALTATALAQVLASLFNPAVMAVVPSLVPEERLGSANALLGAVRQSAFVFGPLLGAIAVGLGGVGLAFILDAATFVASALLLIGMRVVVQPAAGRQPLQIRRDLRLGWATVQASRPLLLVFGSQVLFNALIAVLNVLLVPLLVSQWRAPEELLGALYAAVGAGCLIGSLLALRVTRSQYIPVTLAMLGLIGACSLALGLSPWLWLGLVVLVITGATTLISDVTAHAAIQSSVAGDRLGRVFGLLFWMIAVGQTLGALLGWTAGSFGPGLLVIALGLAVMLAGLLLFPLQRPAGSVAALKQRAATIAARKRPVERAVTLQ